MEWLIYTRQAAMTVATITAIIAHALSSLTINLSVGGVFNGPLQYAHFGVGAGVATILSLPMILLYDMAQEASYSATVLFELIWLAGLSIVWIIVGVKTMGVTSAEFKTCTAAQFGNVDKPIADKLVGLCQDAQTIVVFALLSAGILLLYTAALAIVASMQASSGNPVWTTFKMPKKAKAKPQQKQ